MKTGSIQTRSCAFGVSLALLALALPCAQASARVGGARPGTLERGFGAAGTLSRDFGPEPGSGGASQVILEPDGKQLIRASGGQVGLLMPDGSLDTGFGEGGYLTHRNAVQLALAADGRIAVATATGSPSETATVLRFLPNGAPDPSFGDDGSATVTFPIPISEPKALLSLPDGSLLLVAFSRAEQSVSIEAVKLGPDGEIDSGYGQAGFGLVPLPASSSPEHPGIAVSGERLTVVCSGFIARLNPNGSLDTSLGEKGTVTTDLGLEGGGYNLAIEPDGRMVVATDSGGVARFMPDGSPDPSFGVGGVEVLSALGPPTVEKALSLESDGKILLGGYLQAQPAGSPQDFRLARLQPDGALDPTFGAEGSGVVTTDIETGSEDSGESVAVQPDGDVLLVGSTAPPGTVASERIAAVRYTPDGALDPTYGEGGISIQRPLERGEARVSALATDNKGGVVVTGRAKGQVLVARYLPNGRPDPAFGGDGFVLASPISSYFGQEGDSLSPFPGRHWIVGTGSPAGAALLLYKPNGGLDAGFGEDGIVRSSRLRRIVDVLVTPSDRILAAGYTTGTCRALIEAYKPDGTPDGSFGNGGAMQIGGTISGPCHSHDLHLALRHDGHFLLAGRTNHHFVLSEFSGTDRLIRSLLKSKGDPRPLPERIEALSIDRQGRVLLGGMFGRRMGVVRLNADGAFDRSFGQHGEATRAVGEKAVVNDVEIEPDGGIVAAGRSFPHAGGYWEGKPAVVRFDASGHIDRHFGRNGAWTGASVGTLSSVALGRGGIFGGGWTVGQGSGSDVFLVKLHR